MCIAGMGVSAPRLPPQPEVGPPVCIGAIGAQPSWEVPRPAPRPSSDWPTVREGRAVLRRLQHAHRRRRRRAETQVELLDSGHLFVLSHRPSPTDTEWFRNRRICSAVSND
jgi:hypothetical protein